METNKITVTTEDELVLSTSNINGDLDSVSPSSYYSSNSENVIVFNPAFLTFEHLFVKNKSICYSFTANITNAHIDGEWGAYGFKIESSNIPMRARLYKNGEVISSEYYGYVINFSMLLEYDSNCELIVEFDNASLETEVISYFSYSTCVKDSTCEYDNSIYKFDVYYNQLIKVFNFSEDVAFLIRSLYNKVKNKYPGDSNLKNAWRCSRLLGGIVYGNDESGSKAKFKWEDVAGKVFNGSENEYFTNTLLYTQFEYNLLKREITVQNSNGTLPDFAHLQISLSARLAYKLDLDGFFSNIGTFCSDEDISYLAGWLGDATITNDEGKTSLRNDDYCADLDAENIYRIIASGSTYIDAINQYYTSLSTYNTRANVFVSHLSYETIENMVFRELIDKELNTLLTIASEQGNIYLVNHYLDLLNDVDYHWDTIHTKCPDTYSFLKSLQNRLSTFSQY